MQTGHEYRQEQILRQIPSFFFPFFPIPPQKKDEEWQRQPTRARQRHRISSKGGHAKMLNLSTVVIDLSRRI